MNVPQPDTQSVMQRRSPRDILLIFAPALLITIIGFIVAYQFVEPAPPRHITMATGSTEGAYYRIGKQYQKILAREGIELELIETAGAQENITLLEQPGGPIDIALLQGGAGVRENPEHVESLGSVFYEPIWIFWRGAAPDMASKLAGKRVAGGVQGSGTRNATMQLLIMNGLKNDSVEVVSLSGSDAADALLEGKVDVAIFVSVYDAPYIQQLLLAKDISLMPFDRAEAYQRKFHFLARVVLPRGYASLYQDLPAHDIPLIAPVANLAARDDLHPALVTLLLSAADEIHHKGGVFANTDEFPSAQHVVLPLNESAARYLRKGPPLLQRYLPFWLAVAIDRLVVMLIPLVTLLYPLFKVLPPTYRWRVRYRIFRYYRALLDVESRLHQDPSDEQIAKCRDKLDSIEDRLNEVSVPVSYADNLYNMRLHLKLVRERLDEIAASSNKQD